MTEAEWLACEDPNEMQAFHGDVLSDRQRRLFGCACLRLLWSLIPEEVPEAVNAAELFADRLTTKAALRRFRGQVRSNRLALEAADARCRPRWAMFWLTEVVAAEKAFGAVLDQLNQFSDILILENAHRSAICDLFREVAGNPFRSLTPSPNWLTSSVFAVAHAIYDDRRFVDMPILADALEDAGCDDAAILAHCRDGGPHVRGCWVLDRLLDKS